MRQAIRNAYAAGNVSMRSVARQFDVSVEAVRRFASL